MAIGADTLPEPPHEEVQALIRRANALGLWLSCASHARQSRQWGGRWRVCPEQEPDNGLFASHELDEVAEFLRQR